MKKVFTLFFVFLLVFLFTFSSFAVSDNFSLNPRTDFTLYDSFPNGSVSAVTYNSVSCTRFRNSGQTVTGAFYYHFNNQFIAGNTYTVTFRFSSTDSNSNGDNSFALYLSNDIEHDADAPQIVKVTSLSDSQGWTDYTFSFVYNGQYYLLLSVWLSNYGNIYLTNLNFSRYNPNSLVESQNNQIISQNDEQNSLIDSQNSLIDEQNSRLFDSDEQFTGVDTFQSMEDDLLEGFDSFWSDLNSSLTDFVHSERLTRSVLAVTYFFNNFWQFLSDSSLSWIRMLVTLSVVVSLFLLIFHTGIISNKGNNNKGGKG